MAKKLQRVFRERRLSAAEIARDQEVRSKVEAEFPPAASNRALGPLSQTLKEAVRDSKKTIYQIAQEAGVSQIVISRFLSGERDIRVATADKLADALGLRLVGKR